MDRRGTRGLSLLDLLVSLAFLALLVWLVRLDWQRVPAPPAPVPVTTAHAS